MVLLLKIERIKEWYRRTSYYGPGNGIAANAGTDWEMAYPTSVPPSLSAVTFLGSVLSLIPYEMVLFIISSDLAPTVPGLRAMNLYASRPFHSTEVLNQARDAKPVPRIATRYNFRVLSRCLCPMRPLHSRRADMTVV
jgi:hypothetical protein